MRTSHALGAALGASQIAYGLEAPRPPWMTRAIVGLLLTTSTADAIEQRGARGAAVVAAAGSIGFGAELLGVQTGKPFGPYDYSGKLGPKVADVPVMAAAAWALLARPSRVAGDWAAQAILGGVDVAEAAEIAAEVEALGEVRGPGAEAARPSPSLGRRAARVVGAATALTAWDAFLDPRMVREGYWRWPGGGRYEGIPASNFFGWWVTGIAIFAAAELIDPADEPGGPAAPGGFAGERSGDTALGLYGWTLIGELIANIVLWKRPRVATVGGLSMGLLTVPALVARIRAGSSATKCCGPR